MPLIKEVSGNWWHSDGVKGATATGLFSFLDIPYSKQQEFRKQCHSETEAVGKALEWWLHHSIHASWGELIYQLDRAGETKVADGIMKNAEPPTGIVQARAELSVLVGQGMAAFCVAGACVLPAGCMAVHGRYVAVRGTFL